jgi:hypothetical protein
MIASADRGRACLTTIEISRKSRRIRQILRLFISNIPGCASIDDDAINHA